MNSQTEDSFSEFQKEYACFLEEMSGKEKDGDPPRTSASRESTKRSSNSPASNSQQEAEKVNVETRSEKVEKWLADFFAFKQANFYAEGIHSLHGRWKQILLTYGEYIVD
ncbi:unnamed protein product, partial [Mesorhabditis belari]|uniref:Uncharacterized protein n=1 Tax=Mesorhabditis belari TaxID=2138241 RepID=A0AAF3FHK8_9BILA